VPFRGGGKGAASRVAALASVGGALFAGTAAGLFELRGARFEPVALEGVTAVVDLLADGDDLWIATHDGLFVRDPDGVRKLGGGELRQIAKLGGAVVVAGLGDGLQMVDRGRLVAYRAAPAGLVLAQAIGVGADGATCAGGLDGLWLRGAAADAAWVKAPAPGGLPSNDVSALAVDGSRLWAGTFDQGLVVRERGAWRRVVHPDLDARVNALLVEPRAGQAARIWVATAAGLMMLDGPEAKDVTRLTRRDGMPGRGVLSLARLRDGRVVAGTSTGAVIIEAGGRPVPVGPPGSEIGNVWAVAEDADGMLWLGTTTGVWRGPSTIAVKGAAPGTEWTRMSVATGHLADDWVMGIAVKGRSVWVGGYKGGVVRFDLDAMTATAKLGGGWVNPGGLSWDGDLLVVATQEGLRSGDGKSSAWKTIGGLPGKDVTTVVRAGTTRWIGTRRGLVEE
jgi:ligand-binding sensor domain-containing protein